MHDRFGEQLTALARAGFEMLKEASAARSDLAAQIDALETVAQQLDRDV